ncbi:hypothetical protein G7048_06145 [Diaphorobacter sp. HDW4B]|uniref:hypothetical protein n=1 Tax=Diaphorobacter sp. HDW4B TaxID=2714925 RepID=UPI0014095859|nr:hypothetical protein [Diaphorobacter sp. HDW4B]QIL69975.1 hypothetical protein G7048_06145 [Diaphorobacter sp. HDW4B]
MKSKVRTSMENKKVQITEDFTGVVRSDRVYASLANNEKLSLTITKHYVNGKLHKEDGPAVLWSSGQEEYWLNDQEHTKQEFEQWQDKKHLNDKLQTTLEPKPTEKRSKL